MKDYEHQLYFLDESMKSLNKNIEYMNGKKYTLKKVKIVT